MCDLDDAEFIYEDGRDDERERVVSFLRKEARNQEEFGTPRVSEVLYYIAGWIEKGNH